MTTGSGEAGALRFLWFGSYSTGPGYPRSETLIAGLRARGHEVAQVHAPLFEGAGERVDAGHGRGVGGVAWRQARAAAKLASKWFRAEPHHVAVVGSGGLVDALLLRFLQNVDRRALVLDAFIPLYDTVVRDRGLAAPGSLRARALRRLERLSGRVADVVLADTHANAELLAGDMDVATDKIDVVPVCQVDPGPPAPLPAGGPLRVVLAATYIPLHGVETVVESARILGGEGVEIEIVGRGQTLAAVEPRAAGVPGLSLVREFLPPEELTRRLAAAHVGLGIFGDTAKAARVVPLKAALVLSCGRALITRGGPAAAAALTDAAVLVPPADPAALAAALTHLRDDRAELERLATAGRVRYLERFTPEASSGALLDALQRRGLLAGCRSNRLASS